MINLYFNYLMSKLITLTYLFTNSNVHSQLVQHSRKEPTTAWHHERNGYLKNLQVPSIAPN